MLKSSGWKMLGSLRGPAKQRATDGAIFLKATKMLKLRLVRMMLDGGVDVNWQNEEGQTALMCVITSHTSQNEDPQASSKYAMMDFLLRVGSDPNIRDRNGKTALIHACQMNIDTEIIQLLILSNADSSIRDFTASSAMDYAVAQQNDIVVTILTNASSMKKSVVFTRIEHGKSSIETASQIQSYLQLPKTHNVIIPTAKNAGSPKPLRRQNTICCTGDDTLKRLWEEEMGLVVPDNTGGGPHSKHSSLLHRRNTSAGIPQIALKVQDEREYQLDLDSPYYEMKRVNDSLFEWETKSYITSTKSRARAAWLDKYQKVLKARGTILDAIKDETGDKKMFECAMASRIRSTSLHENQPIKSCLINRSKCEERKNHRFRVHSDTNDDVPGPDSSQVLLSPSGSSNKQNRQSPSPVFGDTKLEDIHPIVIEHPLPHTEIVQTKTSPTKNTLPTTSKEKTDLINDAKCLQPLPPPITGALGGLCVPHSSPRRASADVRPKHPNAKFFNARSKTFNGSKSGFKGEELIETI